MAYHRGAILLLTTALFLNSMVFSLRVSALAATTQINGCDLASEAANSESAAAEAYSKGHYSAGVTGYQQAADFYHLCSVKASDKQSKDRAFYLYIVDLAFAAQHAPNGAALAARVRKEADAFLGRGADATLTANIAALKDDPTHPERIAAAQQTGTSNVPNAPPPNVSGPIDRSACASALAAFWNPYNDWFSARSRYIGSVQKTQRLLPKNDGPSYVYGPASINIILELRAIRSVVDAEEPKLRAAQARLDSTGAAQTASAASEIVQAIQQLDGIELAWTQSRYNTITAAANGQPAPPVSGYDLQTVNQLGAQIKSRWDQLHGATACTN